MGAESNAGNVGDERGFAMLDPVLKQVNNRLLF